MVSFDNTTIEFLQKLHYHRNVVNFFLGFIPRFYDKITATKNKLDETPLNPRWEFLTGVPFKRLITQHQYILPLRQISHIYIWYPVKKEKVHQFHVGYMTHPLLKKHRTHIEKVIKKS